MTIHERLAAAGLPPLPRKAWLEIDEDALGNNMAVFRELIGPRVRLGAVVKADAYGHGLVPAARVFVAAGADRLYVASLDEAMALRAGGIQADILVLYAVPPDGVVEAARNNIQLAVTQADGFPADPMALEVELETGLTRGGLKVDQLMDVLEHVGTGEHAPESLSLWTHLASPDNAAATAAQIETFERATQLALTAEEKVPARHLAATGGLLTGRAPFYEGVRIGLGLYGLLPLDLPIPAHLRPFADRLVPAMQLKCQPVRVDTFPQGTAVGYGGTWVAPRESVIATLPVGYGDGWSRAYSPGGQALARGARVPLVGTVAMDAVMADMTEIEDVTVEDEVVLLGRQGAESITAEELSRARTTIPWEVVTSMSFRLPRVYHAGSVLKGLRTLAGEVRASEAG